MTENFYKRQMRLIVDEMPTGTHAQRADAWDQLARRCRLAAERHRAVVAERGRDSAASWASTDKARRFVRSQRSAEAIIADAAPAPKPPVVSLVFDGECEDVTDLVDAMHEVWARHGQGEVVGRTVDPSPGSKTQIGFTDALGYVRTVEIDVEREPGNEDEP